MRLLILDENYPHLENLMGDVFVHVRAKEYAKKHEVKVFSFFQEPREINYEGINLETFDNIDTLVAAIKLYNPNKILIHFYQSWMLERIIKSVDVPVIIWVHGYEALGWYRRLFNYTLYSPVFFNFVVKNTKQQYNFRKLIQYANETHQIRFVFVSNWMRKITEADTLSKIAHYDIIPNPIDINLFKYNRKDHDLRKKVLLLRSFGSKKYANDISVDAILHLSKSKNYNQFYFTIIGDGQLFDKTLNPIRHLSNVTIKKGPVRQIEIPQLHKEHGVFLCPTRQDAQGVSMCEAMASGLVPITSNNTAIPEYVTGNESGILTNNSNQIAAALEFLLSNPAKFSSLSINASQTIRQVCDIKIITEKELKIIEDDDYKSLLKKQYEQALV
jgi:L-malate glycosyltransferase